MNQNQEQIANMMKKAEEKLMAAKKQLLSVIPAKAGIY